MEGLELLRFLVEATGLPKESVDMELKKLLQRYGIDPEHVTIDDVREIMAGYLQDTLVEAKDSVG
jgi:hypothetical protein